MYRYVWATRAQLERERVARQEVQRALRLFTNSSTAGRGGGEGGGGGGGGDELVPVDYNVGNPVSLSDDPSARWVAPAEEGE